MANPQDKDFFKKEFEEKLLNSLDKDLLLKLKSGELIGDEDLVSQDYETFRGENLPRSFGIFEKFCNLSEKYFGLTADPKSSATINQHLREAYLHCNATGVQSLAFAAALVLILLGMMMTLLLSAIIGFGIVIFGLMSYLIIMKLPETFQKLMRANENDQIILAVFYLVSFMRFNPNFELATTFAAKYLGPPLALDFKRILWELQNQKFPNIKYAYDDYLNKWRETNLDFLQSIYLIQSSLYETNPDRRITMLDKALDTILDGNYEKILHFSQELKSRVSTFNMLGVVLPVLGLILLPLAASFGDPLSVWQVTFLLYSMIIPALVAYFGSTLMVDRPGGVSSIRPPKKLDKKMTSLAISVTKNKTIYINPMYYSVGLFSILFLIGISPLITHYLLPNVSRGLNLLNLPFTSISDNKVISFVEISKAIPPYTFGPYGFYPGIMSIFVTLSIAYGIGSYFFYKYKNLIHIRDRTKRIEKQLSTAFFQLGSRIGEGISSELAFGVVADTLQGTEMGEFFKLIDQNIKFNGMNIESSVYDPDRGAITNYPSDLLTSSMKIFVKSLDQGPEVASKTLIDLSKYMSAIHRAQERLLDLLAEPLSSMKSQRTFLAPVISGIVVSIVFLITTIMGSLTRNVSEVGAGGGIDAGNILGNSIPTFLFQIPVGIYVVFLLGILVYVTSNLENGKDPINTRYTIGLSMLQGSKKYAIITFIGMILFAFIAQNFVTQI